MNKKTLSALLGALVAINTYASTYVENEDNKIEEKENSIIELIERAKKVINSYEEDNTKQVINFGYLKNDSNIYDYLDSCNNISLIDKFQKVVIYNEINGYYFVETENNTCGYINKNNIEILPNLFVEVDISSQIVNLFKDNELIMTTPCVTGHATKHSTRIGYFSIQYKQKDTYLRGPGYSSYVNYWMPFDGGIGLHDADRWRSTYGGDIYITNGSHGCVNMPHDAAETVFNTVSSGTRVLVHK